MKGILSCYFYFVYYNTASLLLRRQLCEQEYSTAHSLLLLTEHEANKVKACEYPTRKMIMGILNLHKKRPPNSLRRTRAITRQGARCRMLLYQGPKGQFTWRNGRNVYLNWAYDFTRWIDDTWGMIQMNLTF